MLMDPIQFASRAMEELAKGDDFVSWLQLK